MFGCKSCMERREAFLVAAHSTSAPRCAARRGKRAPRDAGVANPSGDGGRARSHPGAGLAPRRMQGARQRRQTPVRAYANHQVRRQLGRRRRRAPRCLSVGPAPMSASGPGGERQSDRECPCGDEADALADCSPENLLARRRLAPRRRGVALGRLCDRPGRGRQEMKALVPCRAGRADTRNRRQS